ncbi:hypothetical protein Ancab_013019 [Ancistrocladus abbreviatus]
MVFGIKPAFAAGVSRAAFSTTASRGKTLSSLFANPHGFGITSSNSTFMPPNSASIAQQPQIPLDKFLKFNCKSGNVTLNEAKHFFDRMLLLKPISPISSFNLLLSATVKSKHYHEAISFYKRSWMRRKTGGPR